MMAVPRRTTILQYILFAAVLGVAIKFGYLQGAARAPKLHPHTPLHPPHRETAQKTYPSSDTISVGIHIGSTHARVGSVSSGEFELITDENGRSSIPSYVSFQDCDPPLVGFTAEDQASKNPENTVYDTRRLIGRSFSDPELVNDIDSLPYKVVNIDNKPSIKVQVNDADMFFSPEEISAMIFSDLKRMAEAHLGKVQDAVIAVPSYFNNAQREAVKKAATIAGFNVRRMTNASVAAGIGNGLDRWTEDQFPFETIDCNFVIYNLEDKETEIALEEIYRGVFDHLSLVTAKDFGGDDIENAVFNNAVSEFRGKHNISIGRNSTMAKKLKLDIDNAQKELLDVHSVDIQVLANESSVPVSIPITRVQIEELNKHLSEKVLALLEQLLENAQMHKKDISGVIFSGNAKQVAKVQGIVEAYFDNKKGFVYHGTAHDTAIVHGAAIQAAVFSSPLDIVEWVHSELGLGVETSDGVFTTLIPRWTMLPHTKKATLYTAADNQDRIILKVLEGERLMASKNKVLGTLELRDLPRKPKHELEVEVEFYVDTQNILKVTARVKQSGKEVTHTFKERGFGTYTQQELEAIISDGRESYDQDRALLAGRSAIYNPERRDGVWVPDLLPGRYVN